MIDKENRGGDHKTKQRDRFYVASLAREYTEAAVTLLASTMNDVNLKRTDRVKAAEVLLDRGWGKAPQEIKLGNADEDRGVKLLVEIIDPTKPIASSTDGSACAKSGTPDQDTGAQHDTLPASCSGTAETDQGISGGNP